MCLGRAEVVAGCPCSGEGASEEYIVEVWLSKDGGCDVDIQDYIYTHEGCVDAVYALVFSIGEVCDVSV